MIFKDNCYSYLILLHALLDDFLLACSSNMQCIEFIMLFTNSATVSSMQTQKVVTATKIIPDSIVTQISEKGLKVASSQSIVKTTFAVAVITEAYYLIKDIYTLWTHISDLNTARAMNDKERVKHNLDVLQKTTESIGSRVGSMGGAAAGLAIGSIFPGLGQAVGTIAGSKIGEDLGLEVAKYLITLF